jgi:hypothetical protein
MRLLVAIMHVRCLVGGCDSVTEKGLQKLKKLAM